jgi:hypothetical protein
MVRALIVCLAVTLAAGFIERTPQAQASLRPGDVDGDAGVNSVDAALVLQFDAGLVTELKDEKAADVSGDDIVNSLDAALILQYEGGWISQPNPNWDASVSMASVAGECRGDNVGWTVTFHNAGTDKGIAVLTVFLKQRIEGSAQFTTIPGKAVIYDNVHVEPGTSALSGTFSSLGVDPSAEELLIEANGARSEAFAPCRATAAP